jgi:hypothetical protein
VLFVPAYVSPKSVPPTDTLYGVEVSALTVMPWVAWLEPASELAAPSSPDDTNTDTPFDAASWYRSLMYKFAAAPSSGSDSP